MEKVQIYDTEGNRVEIPGLVDRCYTLGLFYRDGSRKGIPYVMRDYLQGVINILNKKRDIAKATVN